VPFLEDLQPRPFSLADTKGFEAIGLYLGNGPNALEVAVLRGPATVTLTAIRAIWTSRLGGRATPLLLETAGERHGTQSGEAYRQELRKGLDKYGKQIEDLPWGSGSGFLSPGRGHWALFCEMRQRFC
jgi:hypothetical protein